MFFVFTNGFIHYEISRLWEIPPIGYENLEKKYDVAVVLGGISDFDGNYNVAEHRLDGFAQFKNNWGIETGFIHKPRNYF